MKGFQMPLKIVPSSPQPECHLPGSHLGQACQLLCCSDGSIVLKCLRMSHINAKVQLQQEPPKAEVSFQINKTDVAEPLEFRM